VTATHLDLDLPPEVSDKLRRLTEETGRGASSLAGEAIADYVDRELAIIEGIRRGIDDMNAGRLVPHEDAMARIRATIEREASNR
jgi:predicted transcriptional regulator